MNGERFGRSLNSTQKARGNLRVTREEIVFPEKSTLNVIQYQVVNPENPPKSNIIHTKQGVFKFLGIPTYILPTHTQAATTQENEAMNLRVGSPWEVLEGEKQEKIM